MRTVLLCVSYPSFHLAVRWQRFLQVMTHSETERGISLLLLDFRLQLKAFPLTKTVYWWEGEWHFTKETLKTSTPAFQQAATSLSREMRGCPEDLWCEDLEATVVEDTILQKIKNGAQQSQVSITCKLINTVQN